MSDPEKYNYPLPPWYSNEYPVVDIGNMNSIKNRLKRAFAPFSPFAVQQIPTRQRMGMGFKVGNNFWRPDPYPNGIVFNRMWEGHYDPHTEPYNNQFQKPDYAPRPYSDLRFSGDEVPKACLRLKRKYKRCEMINGTDKCKQEAQDILDICPNFVLEGWKENTRQIAKFMAIQNKEYRSALEVSPYNKGRDMSQISDKTWIHGTREYLRPDTMWPDERYSKITQADVNAAQQRVAAREAAQREHKAHDDKHHGKHDEHGHGDHGDHHYDFKAIAFKEEKPLYP